MNDFPRRFGSYVLLKPLARGGMGALYLALSGVRETARLCVIKTVLPHLADKEYLQRFRDEAKVVVRLSHGNLVPVFDSGQVGGEIYLGMDFIEGKDLRAIWNRCARKGIAFPIDVAVHIVKELARGLHYAHTFGDIKLVHRDVSPPNVLLSYSGEVKLTDFGLASSTLKMEKTAPGIIYGKVSYMSPEQARGEPLDGRTDLYAAGIILWELLTGRQLFPSGKQPGGKQDTPTAEELLKRVREPQILPPSRRASRVPAELDTIALKALSPSLPERYASCEELRLDLARFLAQTSPATDSVRVSKFLGELFAEDMEEERRERERLIGDALATFSSPARAPIDPTIAVAAPVRPAPPAAAPSPPPPPVAAPDPPAAPAALSFDERAREQREREERDGRGTLVAGPGARKPAPARVATGEEVSMEAEPPEQTDTLSAAVVGTLVGGRYQVRRFIAEGGMGRVYEAEHIEIGKRVALKILHPAYSQTPDLVERLRREARAASKISHPNVVDVTDSGTTAEGAFFFVMEYLEGIELGELIHREGRLDVARAVAITTQVCRALAAAHAVNVIHRDLKPENVLVMSRDGQREFVKVLDFGIAKSGDPEQEADSRGHKPRRLTHPGMTMGTPEYMAPEQASGRPADPRSDIYAVGGILYEMLSANPPYEGANFMEILHKKTHLPPEPLSRFRTDVPPELEALILRTLAKEPSARPQTMGELEAALQPFLSSDSGSDRQARTPVPETSRHIPKRRSDGPTALLLARLRGWERKKVIIAAGGMAGLLAAFIAAAATRTPTSHPAAATAAVVSSAPPVAAPKPPAPVPPAPASPPVVEPAAEAAPAEPAERPAAAEETEGTRAAAKTALENRRLLEEANQLLRAERFREAADIFQKLSKSKRERGPALMGLAEIAFQQRNYGEAARSARQAASRGGGVRARVLLGDACFRLHQYKEAAAAYGEALKIDPSNVSARTGLALANKRM